MLPLPHGSLIDVDALADAAMLEVLPAAGRGRKWNRMLPDRFDRVWWFLLLNAAFCVLVGDRMG
jgi:hypothetical protein